MRAEAAEREVAALVLPARGLPPVGDFGGDLWGFLGVGHSLSKTRGKTEVKVFPRVFLGNNENYLYYTTTTTTTTTTTIVVVRLLLLLLTTTTTSYSLLSSLLL